MSSIVKKSTHFIPNVKRPVRKRGHTRTQQIVTPEPTQDKKASLDEQDQARSQEGIDNTQVRSSQLDNINKVPEGNIEVETSVSLEKTAISAAIESSDEEQDYEEDDDQEFNDYGDIDIFKNNSDDISQAHRRLSGITPNTLRHRSTSVSMTPTTPSKGVIDSPKSIPMRIEIPISKPTKRRRSLVGVRPGTHKKSSLSFASSNIHNSEQYAEMDEEQEDNLKSASSALISGDSRFIVGVDPETNRLRKFRILRANENRTDKYYEGGRKIPVAPEDLNTNITSASQLPKKVRDEDMALYAQVGVDVGEITMADLCKPNLPIGELSDNYSLVKEAQNKIKKEKEQRKRDRRIARQKRVALEEVNGHNALENQEVKKEKDLLIEEEPRLSSTLKLTMKDGKISYDEDSTVRGRNARPDNNNKSREESNPYENPITSSTYSKRKHTDRWTSEELKQFYEALSTWGTDFTFIAQLFPYRTRKQIKSKFNLEEKRYPEIIEMALKRKLPADFEKYCKDSKNKFETLEFYNEELKQVRVNHEEHMDLIVKERERAMQEDAEANRRREIELRTGSKPLPRNERIKELRKNQMVIGTIEDIKKQRND
ncbi:uncharacterized protein PRCAT00004185001 [Priceomyces carsonii]|uniref:uncharacterized protein n=1 Tax=Priceomyces carsonii TaxID=28549 RepID=UPI002ED81568|nr:unnamed protein product [Priceomyces carsonii]